MANKLAPVVLFVYNRIDTLKSTIRKLSENHLAGESNLIIFSDAAKTIQDQESVSHVRRILREIKGFKSIEIILSDSNKGLANSVISGVSLIMSKYGKAIVIEDDLITSPNFLEYMNQSLEKYEKNDLVFSISGFVFNFGKKKSNSFDVFFTKRHCSWGWATWQNRWDEIDWSVLDFENFKRSKKLQSQFNKIGSDLSSSLIKQMTGKINSWAIRCNYHQFKRQTFTVYPFQSKVENIGYGQDATHTSQRFRKYQTTLDSGDTRIFALPDVIYEDKKIIKSFTRRFSRATRIRYFLLNRIMR